MIGEQGLEIALWRTSVLGALVSTELAHGELRMLCKRASQRYYRHPDGRIVQPSPRTIEDWYYLYRKGGLAALKPVPRKDKGTSRAISDELASAIIDLKREKPRRSIRRIIKMLVRDGQVTHKRLSRSSVHRLLRSHGISECPPRDEQRERRAFRHAFAGDCWMGDVMHAIKAIDHQGKIRKTYLHAFIDSATRFVPTCAFRFHEKAEDFEIVLKSGILKHGLVRMLYIDNGAAQKAGSLRLICAELGVHKKHAKVRDGAAKAGIERWFRTVRAELLDELPEEPMPIEKLNGLLWAWLSCDYHSREHGGTGRIPLNHWLEHIEHLRPSPSKERLDKVFLHREQRVVRKDNTLRYYGRLLEVYGDLAGETVELRFDAMRPFATDDPTTFPKVYVDNDFVCDTTLLDLIANSTGKRRPKRKKTINPPTKPTGINPLQQSADEQAHITRAPSSLSTTPNKSRR